MVAALCLLFHLSFPGRLHPSIPPSHPNLSSNSCLWALRLSISPFIFHFSPSIIHPSVTCPQGPANDGCSLKHIFPLICFPPLNHPSPVPPRPPFIFPQSPAVSASASEPSPPRTWRPRSPAPRKGSELEHRKRS